MGARTTWLPDSLPGGAVAQAFAKSTPEQILTNHIFSWFEIQRSRNPTRCYVFRVKTMGVYDQKLGRYRRDNSRWSKRGTSDLVGSWKTLHNEAIRPLAIEIKAPKGTVSDDQKKFIAEATAAGWIAFIARSVEDVKRELALADAGNKYLIQEHRYPEQEI